MKIVSRDQFEDSLSPIYLNHKVSKAWNIEPKIEAINNISNKKLKYAIRYKKHVSRCNKYFSKLDLINLSSSNMGINKTLLEAQFKKKSLY